MLIDPNRFRWLPNTVITDEGIAAPDVLMEAILDHFYDNDKEHAMLLSQRLTSSLIANVMISKMIRQEEEN